MKPEMKARRLSQAAMYSEAWLSSDGTTKSQELVLPYQSGLRGGRTLSLYLVPM